MITSKPLSLRAAALTRCEHRSPHPRILLCPALEVLLPVYFWQAGPDYFWIAPQGRLKAGALEDATERVQAWAAAAAARAAQEREFEPWLPLIKRGLQDFRLAATYVDQSGSPGSWNDPQTVDPDVTRTLCISGLLFLVLVFALAEAARPGLAIRDLATFPADFTGMDVLSNLLERLQSSAPQLAAALRPTAPSDT